MRLPREISEDGEIIFGAVSRWRRQDENPDFYVTGFQIQEMDGDIRASVMHLISEFVFLD